MTTPLTGFTPAAQVMPPTYYSLQINSTDQGVEISEILGAAVLANLIGNGTSKVNKVNGQLTWTISITTNDGVTSFCTTGDYIVVGTDPNGNMISIALYNGPGGTYNNPPFSSVFTS